MTGIPSARVVAVIARTASGGVVQFGTGYLLDATRILTARHCVIDPETGRPAVSLRVQRVSDGAAVTVTISAMTGDDLDVALLAADEQPPWSDDPPGGPVTFGRLDREHSGQLDNCQALGFPRWKQSGIGGYRDVAEVHGLVRALEGMERQRLVLRDPVLGRVGERGSPWAGFSGAAVFYGGLLIGVVIEHHVGPGDTALHVRPVEAVAESDDPAARQLADALGLGRVGAFRPVTEEKRAWRAEEAEEPALAQWGWSLERDPEGVRHWRPRARGVSVDSERGWRFRGRTAALTEIVSWLDRPVPDRRVLVVTGSPGTGKSAVLGRVVTTADSAARTALPPDDTAVKASAGSVHCAVHAKGKTALEVAAEIARAASAKFPERIEDFAPALEAALREPGRSGSQDRFNVVIDALDEASSPKQAREIIRKVILPIAETFAYDGARVVAGSRRSDGGGDLLRAFEDAGHVIDLDTPEYFEEEDLAGYALACLQMDSNERPGSPSPYADTESTRPLAEAIARAADGNFLVGGLVARTRGLYDKQAANPARLRPVRSVRDALEEYLKRLPEIERISAYRLLTALAFAEDSGLTADLWKLAVEALPPGGPDEDWPVQVQARRLDMFARLGAANFLVETNEHPGPSGRGRRSYRLFHKALSEALLAAREEFIDRADDERALTEAFFQVGRGSGWNHAPAYLLRSLPGHAARGGLVDDLLADDDYLLHADLRRLMHVVGYALSPPGKARARLLGLTPESVTADSPERAALFSVTEALDGLGTAYRNDLRPVPYRALWASTVRRHSNLMLKVSDGWIGAVCTVDVGGKTLLAGGGAGTVHLWDPGDGTEIRTLKTDYSGVNALCSVAVGGRSLLATGGQYGTVKLWDPMDGTEVRTLYVHHDGVRAICAVCAIKVGKRSLLAAVCYRGQVQLWDPEDGTGIRTLNTHHDHVKVVCGIDVGDRTLLVIGGDDSGALQLWDLADGTRIRTLNTDCRWVEAVCEVEMNGQTLIAVGGHGGKVELRDLTDGAEKYTLHTGYDSVEALCAIMVDGRTLLVVFGDNGRAQLWDLATGVEAHSLNVHHSGVRAVCTVESSNRILVATAGGYPRGNQRIIQLWDLRAAPSNDDSREIGAGSKCAVNVDDRILLAAGGRNGKVHLCDPANGAVVRTLKTHYKSAGAMCTVNVGEKTLLVVRGSKEEGLWDQPVQLWDPAGGTQVRTLNTRHDWMVSVKAGEKTLLAGVGDRGTVQLWDPANGARIRTLNTRLDWLQEICRIDIDNQCLFAVCGSEGMVQLWDPQNGTRIRTLKTQHRAARAICEVKDDGRSLLATGGSEGMVQLWDPENGTRIRTLKTQHDGVMAICTVKAADRTLLASGGDDRTVQLWNPADGRLVLTIPVHHAVTSMAAIAGSLIVNLTAGVLVIDCNACRL